MPENNKNNPQDQRQRTAQPDQAKQPKQGSENQSANQNQNQDRNKMSPDKDRVAQSPGGVGGVDRDKDTLDEDERTQRTAQPQRPDPQGQR